jgi:hypothetical protein
VLEENEHIHPRPLVPFPTIEAKVFPLTFTTCGYYVSSMLMD